MGCPTQAKTPVWEFGEAMTIGQPRKNSSKPSTGSANAGYSAGGDLLIGNGDIVGRWKELLNPIFTLFTEEAEAGNSEENSAVAQAEVTVVVSKLRQGGGAFGVDELHSEYLKSLEGVRLSWLIRLVVGNRGTGVADWGGGTAFEKGGPEGVFQL